MVGKEKDFDTINDGSHAIRKFNFVDVLIIVILVILAVLFALGVVSTEYLSV